MSRENVEIVRQMWDAYTRGDFRASLAAFSEDTVWDDTNYRPDGAVHVGPAAVADLVIKWREAWDPISYEVHVEHVEEASDGRVVALLRESGRGAAGGVDFSNRWAQVSTVRGGKIATTVVYRTPEEALRDVGLSE
jgi:ketosteroid isomerase-like protein